MHGVGLWNCQRQIASVRGTQPRSHAAIGHEKMQAIYGFTGTLSVALCPERLEKVLRKLEQARYNGAYPGKVKP